MSQVIVKARCHCGAVEIEARLPTQFVVHCFCQSCRKTHAAGSVAFAGFTKDQVRIARGEEHISNYESSPQTWRKFCKNCGTRLGFETNSNPSWANEFHVPLALFLSPLDRAPHANSFLHERPEWAPYHEL